MWRKRTTGITPVSPTLSRSGQKYAEQNYRNKQEVKGTDRTLVSETCWCKETWNLHRKLNSYHRQSISPNERGQDTFLGEAWRPACIHTHRHVLMRQVTIWRTGTRNTARIQMNENRFKERALPGSTTVDTHNMKTSPGKHWQKFTTKTSIQLMHCWTTAARSTNCDSQTNEYRLQLHRKSSATHHNCCCLTKTNHAAVTSANKK